MTKAEKDRTGVTVGQCQCVASPSPSLKCVSLSGLLFLSRSTIKLELLHRPFGTAGNTFLSCPCSDPAPAPATLFHSYS